MTKRIITIFIAISTILLVASGCCRQKVCKTKLSNDNPFNFIPAKCNVIGMINFAKLRKIDAVKKQIEANKDKKIVKDFQAAGLGSDDINSIYFATTPPPPPVKVEKGAAHLPLPGIIMLIKTNKKIHINKFVAIAEKEINKKISPGKIGTQTIYSVPANDNQKLLLTMLSDNILAIGSKDIIESALSLKNGAENSIANKPKLMNLTNNTERNDMFWLGCVFNKEAIAAFGENFPAIKSGLVYGNYLNDKLTIGGTIKCATNQDVQKILAPAQIFTGLLLMNTKSGFKPGDITLTPKQNTLGLKISLSKKTIETWVAQQAESLSTEKEKLIQQAISQPKTNPSGFAKATPDKQINTDELRYKDKPQGINITTERRPLAPDTTRGTKTLEQQPNSDQIIKTQKSQTTQ